jgi:hypothetical protein
MTYFESKEQVIAEGTFITYAYGYYSFELEDGEVLAFDEVDKRVLEKYDLKSRKFADCKFEIHYSIIIDDTDEEDFVILRLDDLRNLES